VKKEKKGKREIGEALPGTLDLEIERNKKIKERVSGKAKVGEGNPAPLIQGDAGEGCEGSKIFQKKREIGKGDHRQ